MTAYLLRMILVTTTIAFLLAACTFPGQLSSRFRSQTSSDDMSAMEAQPVHVVKPRPRIVQRGHGEQAAFVRCAPPQCPIVSRKTLAEEPITVATAPAWDAGLPQAPIEAVLPSPDESVVADPPPERQAPRAASQSGFEPPRDLAPAALTSETLTVTFDFDSSHLSESARSAIDRASATWGSAANVIIRGRTDSLGPAPANEALAWARARAVRDYLRRFHPALSGRAVVEARGSCCFAATNKTSEGRAVNRRVEIEFELHGN